MRREARTPGSARKSTQRGEDSRRLFSLKPGWRVEQADTLYAAGRIPIERVPALPPTKAADAKHFANNTSMASRFFKNSFNSLKSFASSSSLASKANSAGSITATPSLGTQSKSLYFYSFPECA